MCSEYEAELRELRGLKETSGDAEVLKRELSGSATRPSPVHVLSILPCLRVFLYMIALSCFFSSYFEL
jgi:hypothetical protein